jgi:hypothetical protein
VAPLDCPPLSAIGCILGADQPETARKRGNLMSAGYAKPKEGLEHKTVSQVRSGVRSAVYNPGVQIAGECVAPRRINTRWNFDLVSISSNGLDVLPCTIWEDQAGDIATNLETAGRSLEEAICDGMLLKVSGTTWLASDGRVCLRVTDVAPDFSRGGELFLDDQRSWATPKAAGANAARLMAPYVHADPETAFAAMERAPRRIMVLAPDNSQGLGDFKRRLGSKKDFGPEITFRGFSWPSAEIETLHKHLEDAAYGDMDLVVILRGGGHWSDLRGFEREDLALATHESKVPVATAVGHDADVSLADRAATLSFATPTAAAEAINTELKRRYWIKKKASSRSNERRKQRGFPQDGQAFQRSAAFESLEREFKEATSRWQQKLQAAVASGQGDLRSAFRLHTQDLVESAEQRVRMISQFVTIGTLAAAFFLIFAAGSVLEFSVGTVKPADFWFYYAVVTAAGGTAVWLQRRARQTLLLPATKQLKRPPTNVDEWRFAIKGVKTISGFRKLLLHRPC